MQQNQKKSEFVPQMNIKLEEQKTALTEKPCTTWHQQKCAGNMMNRFGVKGKAACLGVCTVLVSVPMNSALDMNLHSIFIG